MAKTKTNIVELDPSRSIDRADLEVEINALLVAIEEEDVPVRLLDLASQLQKALQDRRKNPH